MTEERKQELRLLLKEATKKENLEIWYEHGRGYIYEYAMALPAEEYWRYVRDRWACYSAEPLGFSSSVKPNIVNEAVKLKLLAFIRHELACFIERDNACIASYIIEGSPANGFCLQPCKDIGLISVNEWLIHVLKIAMVCGIEESITNFEWASCVKGSQSYFQHVVSLQGINLESEISVFQGVRLVTAPDHTSGPIPASLLQHMPSFLFFLARESESSAHGKTLLLIDRPAYTKCYNPSYGLICEETRINDLPYQFNLDGEKFTHSAPVESFEELFCQALSLACNVAVQISGRGLLFAEEKFFHPGNGGVRLSRSPGPFAKAKNVGETEINEAICLYNILKQNTDLTEKLRIPIERWIQSKTPQNPIDQIIDLGIAFEAIYVPDSGQGEIRFKLAIRAARHLGENENRRKTLMNAFQEIYDWRSAIVHTGNLPKKKVSKKKRTPYPEEEVVAFINNAQDLCRESIMKILHEGNLPDWNNLLLRGEVEKANSA